MEVRNCARCGEDHDVHFEKFTSPVQCLQCGQKSTHWGICPVLKEPIIMHFVDDDKPKLPKKPPLATVELKMHNGLLGGKK